MRDVIAPAIGVLATLLVCYLVPSVFSQQVGTTTILIHLALTGWMLWYWFHNQSRTSSAQFRHLLVLGVIARCSLLLVPPFTTHDVERYLWDGAVAIAGLDPYLVAPEDAIAQKLRSVWPTPQEHAAYATLYPPLALALYALCALAGPVMGIWLWKFLLTLASIATLFIVADLLKHTNQTRHLALIALSPLMLLEVGIGAHVDGFSALALSGALWAGLRARWWLVGSAIGLGACVKLLPILALGPFLFAKSLPFAEDPPFTTSSPHTNSLSRWSMMIAGTFGTIGLIYGSAFALDLQPIGNLVVFFDSWRNGSPVNALLEWTLPELSHLYITLPLAALFGAYALYRAQRDLFAGLVTMLAIPLLLSPVVFPWYLLILVPLLSLRPSAWLLLWVTTVPFAYEVLNRFETTGEWSPAVWPLLMIAGGWLIGWLIDRYSAHFTGMIGTRALSSNKD